MNDLRTTTIRPGFLVSLKTSLQGNVSYTRRDLEPDQFVQDGSKVAKWETERTVMDPAEKERGDKARTRARTTVTKICTVSTFGMLCPEHRRDELSAAIAEARKIADEFNGGAVLSRLQVGIIVGRVAQDDVEAARAINSEVRQLMDDMTAGIQKLDVEAVREAATRAKDIGQMLTPEAQAKVKFAIDQARNLATRMVKAGDQAAAAIDQATLNAIAGARTAFLDLDDQGEIAAPAADQRALDLTPVDPPVPVQAVFTEAPRALEV